MQTVTVRETKTYPAVQLTKDSDWEEIAKWCHGKVYEPDEFSGLIRIVFGPYNEIALIDDWIVDTAPEAWGGFIVCEDDDFAAKYAVVPRP